MRSTQRRTMRLVIIAVVALAAVGASCTTMPPPGGTTYVFQATSVNAEKTPGDWPPTFWDNDAAEEPYLVHLGLRIKLNAPIAVTTSASSIYNNGGQVICKINQGETCPGVPLDGPVFPGLQLPDVLDLANGSNFEIVGAIEFLFERDALIPIGIAPFLAGLSELINAALPPIIANSGVPSEPQALLAFLGALLPGIFTTIGGVIGAVLGNLIGADELFGVAPVLFIAVGGVLASILRSSLPTLLNLITFALAQQTPNPFPNGLPFGIGVVGDGPTLRFATEPAADPTRIYNVSYGWTTI